MFVIFSFYQSDIVLLTVTWGLSMIKNKISMNFLWSSLSWKVINRTYVYADTFAYLNPLTSKYLLGLKLYTMNATIC